MKQQYPTSTSHVLLSSSLPSSSSGTAIKGDVAAVRGTTLAGLRWHGGPEKTRNTKDGVKQICVGCQATCSFKSSRFQRLR